MIFILKDRNRNWISWTPISVGLPPGRMLSMLNRARKNRSGPTKPNFQPELLSANSGGFSPNSELVRLLHVLAGLNMFLCTQNMEERKNKTQKKLKHLRDLFL